MQPHSVLVTGLYRSGTTLLQKLLDAHAEISMPYQKTFETLMQWKQHFYEQQQLPERYYVIDPCFPREEYTQAAFDSYLREQDFPDSFLKLCQDFRTKEQAQIFGSRESFCEEFIPTILQAGGKAIVIIRDIRDVLASANFGKGGAYMGALLPTLYHIRMWRRSVAYALALATTPGFHWLRYEDLVQNPVQTLGNITAFLGVNQSVEQMIHDVLHSDWQGNSSHAKKTSIDVDSVGKYRTLLSPDVVAYVEATCAPELLALGYAVQKPVLPEKILVSFREPFTIKRQNFEQDYSMHPTHITQEQQRLSLLRSGTADTEEQQRWFVMPGAYERLREHA